MASYLKSSDLITSIKRRGALPDSDNAFSDNDYLALANEEIQLAVVPHILSYQEEYFVTSETVDLEDNKSRYAIPERAIGNKLRDIYYIDTDENLKEMHRINPQNRTYFDGLGQTTSNTPFCYYIENNDVVTVPDIGTSVTGSIRMYYYLRPNQLVPDEEVAVITAINTSGSNKVYTVDAVPTAFSTSETFDLLQTKSGHKTYSMDLTSSAIDTSALTLTFLTADVSGDIVVGDYITLAGECNIPQIPDELHPLLSERVVARCLEAIGDREGLGAANAKIAEMENKSAPVIDNRVEGNPLKINNVGGLLHQGKLYRYGRGK